MLDQLRLESFGCMIRVSTAVNILGWVWIIINVISIIGILWILLPLFSSPSVPEVIIAALVTMIKIILIMLVMNFFLLKRNRSGSFNGVKSILRIICKIQLSLMMIVNLIFLLFLFLYLLPAININVRPFLIGSFESNLMPVMLIVAIVLMIFLSLGIHGVRKNRKSLINVYIPFIMVLVVVQILLQILSHFNRQRDNPGSLGSLIVSVVMSLIYFILHIGYFVVLYNIMDVNPEEDQEMKPI